MHNKGWGVYIDIIPLDDLYGHIRGEQCWCNPTRDEDGRIIHNAADMREETEELTKDSEEPCAVSEWT